MHWAAKNGHVNVLEVLLAAGGRILGDSGDVSICIIIIYL